MCELSSPKKKKKPSSMQSFPSFILNHFSANYKEISTFVSLQLEKYLMRLGQLSPLPFPMTPFEKYYLYSIPYISWLNYSSLALDTERSFPLSVFVQSHLFNS